MSDKEEHGEDLQGFKSSTSLVSVFWVPQINYELYSCIYPSYKIQSNLMSQSIN
jgi:hypothetical protein